MSNVVGSLVVKLAAQTAEFSKGLHKATEEAAQASTKIESRLAGIGSGFKSLVTGLAGAFTVERIGHFMLSIVERGDQISKQADKLNMTAEAYQRIARAAEEGGVSTETVASAIQRMSANIGQGKLNIGKYGVAGGLSPLDTFKAIGDAISKIEDPMQRFAALREAFGKGGMELEAVLRNLNQNEWKVISDEQIERLREAKEVLEKAGQQITVWGADAITGVTEAASMTGRIWSYLFAGGEGPGEEFVRQAEAANAKRRARAQQQERNMAEAAARERIAAEERAAERIAKAQEERATAADRIRSQFDPLYVFQQQMQALADVSSLLPREIYDAAVAGYRKRAVAGLVEKEPFFTTSPTGAMAGTQEAYRAILEIEKARENTQGDKMQKTIDLLNRIEQNTRQKTLVADVP